MYNTDVRQIASIGFAQNRTLQYAPKADILTFATKTAVFKFKKMTERTAQ